MNIEGVLTAAPLDHISENILMGQFINGLKEKIRVEVQLLNPINLQQATELAMRVEERNKVSTTRKKMLGAIKTNSGSFTRGSMLGATGYNASQTSPSHEDLGCCIDRNAGFSGITKKNKPERRK